MDDNERLKVKLQFKKLHIDAQLPKRQSEHAAGYDLHAVEDVTLFPGRRQAIKTGVAVALPEGTAGFIWPRSGMAVKMGADRLAGLVDSDYRGEVMVALINHGYADLNIKRGDRIGQIVVSPVLTQEPEWADELPETVRGEDGFGSSGA